MELSSRRNIKYRMDSNQKDLISQGGMYYGSTTQYAGSECQQNVRW